MTDLTICPREDCTATTRHWHTHTGFLAATGLVAGRPQADLTEPAADAANRPAVTVPTRHETPPALLDALLAMNAAIDQFAAAKAAIESAARDLEAIRVSRLDHMDLDWSEPEHMWLNAFACIRPTDEFAAQVGHGVIRAAMQAHPKRATFTVNAS